jgi:hypothetical protein
MMAVTVFFTAPRRESRHPTGKKSPLRASGSGGVSLTPAPFSRPLRQSLAKLLAACFF